MAAKSTSGAAQAALGLRAHSGWAALVAIAGAGDSLRVIERRRITLADPALAASVQPYHAAERLPLGKAEPFLNQRIDSSRRLACQALATARDDLREQGYNVVACGLLVGSPRPLPALGGILASHALIHTAEGVMFREVLAHAAGRDHLRLTRVTERELFDRCQSELGMTRSALDVRLAEIGRALDPPWREDQKYATLAGWLALRRSGERGVDAQAD